MEARKEKAGSRGDSFSAFSSDTPSSFESFPADGKVTPIVGAATGTQREKGM